ncbi:MAG TPA: hypothetical protein VJJ23_01875 [Candidatus Nanoarchaeia archaeon]|nr:hypothetical protein [Candidatus Nanoarchaeia archaeon]
MNIKNIGKYLPIASLIIYCSSSDYNKDKFLKKYAKLSGHYLYTGVGGAVLTAIYFLTFPPKIPETNGNNNVTIETQKIITGSKIDSLESIIK